MPGVTSTVALGTSWECTGLPHSRSSSTPTSLRILASALAQREAVAACRSALKSYSEMGPFTDGDVNVWPG